VTEIGEVATALANVVAIASATIFVGLLVFRRWPVRELSGAFLSYAFAFPAQLAINGAAESVGLWRYDIVPRFLATPLQLGVGLACIFGPLAFLVLRKWRLSHVVLTATIIDAGIFLWTVDASLPGTITRLCAVAGIVATAQLLGRMTATNTHTRWRAAMQTIAWIAFIFWLFPSAVFAQTGKSWSTVLELSPLTAVPLGLVFAIFLLMGLNATQEFALRGDGTPFPFDPPRRLVASGAYAYVRNPMQLSICGCLLAMGALFAAPWIALGALEAMILFVVFKHVCAGTSTVKHDDPLAAFYQTAVRAWLPRWWPSFVGRECSVPADTLMCPANSALARWFGRQALVGLVLVAKEEDGYAFQSGDGRYRAYGIAAVGQAFQHVNLLLAAVGWLLCLLPISRHATNGKSAGARMTGSTASQR
jgi:protein-S-isoprenylcysteine O-methyltransferase Ste14